MSLQFILDNKGNTTGVYIPIEEWQNLKAKYNGLEQKEIENNIELATWQKNILKERLNDYYLNPSDVIDFDKTIDDIEKSL